MAVGDFSTDFDEWLVETFARVGAFTVLIVLVEIDETTATPVRSTYVHVIGDDIRWSDITQLFADAGTKWDGAAFYQADRAGLVRDPLAQYRLETLMRHLKSDRSLLKHSDFFNPDGLRLKIEEVASG